MKLQACMPAAAAGSPTQALQQPGSECLLEERVAAAVQARWAALPKAGKPQPHEHTVLAGFAISRQAEQSPLQFHSGAASSTALEQQPPELEVVALGTGTK